MSDVAITSNGDLSNSPQRPVSGIVRRDEGDKRIVYIHIQDEAGGAFYTMGDIQPSADGSWGLTVTLGGLTPNPTPGSGFSPGVEGEHRITAQLRVAYDNTLLATSAPVVYTLVRTPPTLTFSGLPAGTANPTLSVSGTIDINHYRLPVSIIDNGITLKQIAAGSDGRWNTSITLASPGRHSLSAAAMDQAGNRGESPPVTTVYSPAVPQLSISSASKENTPAGIFLLSGRIDAADMSQQISIFDGTNKIADVLPRNVAPDGLWVTYVALGAGTHSLTAKATNGAGTGTSAPFSVQGAAP